MSRIADVLRKAREEAAADLMGAEADSAGQLPLHHMSEVEDPWQPERSTIAARPASPPVPIRPAALTDEHVRPSRVSTEVDRLTPAPVPDDAIVSLVDRLFLSRSRHMPDVRRVLFTDVDGEGGAAQIARQVAEVLAAESASFVCLAEMDAGGSPLHRHYDVAGKRGFADALAGHTDSAYRVKSRPNLWVMPRGVQGGSESASEDRAGAKRLSETLARFDYFVSHRTVSRLQEDTKEFRAVFDGVVLVVDAAATSPQALRDGAQALEGLGVRLLGTVIRPMSGDA